MQKCTEPVTLAWDDIRFFLAIVKHGRLAQAARALGVEHTTVSRRLAALERAVGAPLFDRTKAGHLLTRAGHRVVAQAEAMARAARGFETEAHHGRAQVEGRVRLALVESFAVTWLAPNLPRLSRQHPGLSLDVVTGNAQSDLSRGEAELAVRSPRPSQRELAAVKIGVSSFTLFGTEEVAARLPRAALDGDLPMTGEVPLLAYTPDLTFLQSARWFRDLLGRSRIGLLTNSTLTLLAAARAGAGAVVLPEFAVKRAPELVRLTRRDVSRQEAWLVTHPEFRRDPRVRAVSEFLRAIGPELEHRA